MHPTISVIQRNVKEALREDLGTGDIHQKLISKDKNCDAYVIARSPGVLCGEPWATEVFRMVDQSVNVTWLVTDGEPLVPNQPFLQLHGKATSLLTAERTCLNFLQLLSATATQTRQCVNQVKHTNVTILDTRKTIPGLRVAQKYAVSVGGGVNHRMGLYDAYLIKENHIRAAGSIASAVETARRLEPDVLLEVEVESLNELNQAVVVGVTRVLLDNFSTEQMREAVRIYGGQIELEASGGIDIDNLVEIAETGVDYISLGSLTKNIQAVDLSMQLST